MFKLTVEGEARFKSLNEKLESISVKQWPIQDVMDWTILSLVNEGLDLDNRGTTGPQEQMIRRQLLRSYNQGWIDRPE